jgi:2-dehydro-3-deoxy-D-arabinonate dehydratase
MTNHVFLTGVATPHGTKPVLQKNGILYTLDTTRIAAFDELLQSTRAADFIAALEAALGEPLPPETPITLKGLLNHQQIWAAGVTYKISEEARERESHNSTIYTRVYSAERPELFWKSVGYEAVSGGDTVGIRYDATWSVPEPELTVVYNAHQEVIGFTIGNDMSSRDIEGSNPLYLPQAKVYELACALGPKIWLQPNAAAFPVVDIQIEIARGGSVVFSGVTSSSRLKRTLPELTDYLGRCKAFKYGVLLLTGTGVVPGDDFTLAAGDVVSITVDPIGTLTNTVQIVERR